jgi:release factor glutamine methyltransferase
VAKFAGDVYVTATDISTEALEIAAANVAHHCVQDRVRLVRADGLDLPPGEGPEKGFDLIVSNPPYISHASFDNLPPHIRDHEPAVALRSPAADGLEMHRRFAHTPAQVLAPQGRLLVEIAFDQRDAVIGIFAEAGWTHVGTHRNRNDPHDRALEFQRS